MPPYYSLLVPAGLALFSAIVGIIALFLERRRARQAEAASGTQSRAAYGLYQTACSKRGGLI